MTDELNIENLKIYNARLFSRMNEQYTRAEKARTDVVDRENVITDLLKIIYEHGSKEIKSHVSILRKARQYSDERYRDKAEHAISMVERLIEVSKNIGDEAQRQDPDVSDELVVLNAIIQEWEQMKQSGNEQGG